MNARSFSSEDEFVSEVATRLEMPKDGELDSLSIVEAVALVESFGVFLADEILGDVVDLSDLFHYYVQASG